MFTKKKPITTAALFGALFSTLLLAGCAATAERPMPQERNSTGDLVPYEGELINEEPFGWESGTMEVVDDNHVRVSFEIPGPDPCTRYAATTGEFNGEIAVHLTRGHLPGTDGRCPNVVEPEPGEIRQFGATSETETIVVPITH